MEGSETEGICGEKLVDKSFALMEPCVEECCMARYHVAKVPDLETATNLQHYASYCLYSFAPSFEAQAFR